MWAFVLSPSPADQQAGSDAEAVVRGTVPKGHFIARFDIPTDVLRRPQHEVRDRRQSPEGSAVGSGTVSN